MSQYYCTYVSRNDPVEEGGSKIDRLKDCVSSSLKLMSPIILYDSFDSHQISIEANDTVTSNCCHLANLSLNEN